MIKVDETDPVGELEPSFPYRDVQIRRNTDVKEFYDLQSEIGRGKFGTVYRCREKSTGLSLAAKFVSVARKEDRRNVEREVDIMRSLQHPRLLQLYDAFEFDKNVCLILELIEGGELFERVIDDDFVLTEKACTVFMRQICEGIAFIHQQHILHLDLKPENILCLTKTGNRIKIIDFGLARRYEPGKRLQVLFGTPEFVAPEVVNFDQIGFNTDLWSVGVICYVLLSGLSPFMGDTDIETMANVTIAKYDFDDEVFNDISDDAKDFISKLLVKEKENRMCAEACLHHRWLKRKKPPPPNPNPPALPEKRALEEVTLEDKQNNNVPSQQPPLKRSCTLENTKDNLKNIVERWSEHPDSPYIFDTTAHTISPCPSLASVLGPDAADAIEATHSVGEDKEVPDRQLTATPEQRVPPLEATETRPPYERLSSGGSERRASDSRCLVRLKSHHLDIHDRINLADEIRKLSDKLFKMASFQTAAATTTAAAASESSADACKRVSSSFNDVESSTVTETRNGMTTTKTTFKSAGSDGSNGIVTSTVSSTTSTSSNGAATRTTRTESLFSRSSSRALSEGFRNKATQMQIPIKKFWPLDFGRISHDCDDFSPERLARRSLSSTSSTTTHSAPPSPRWSPDPELPPPPTSDLLLRLLHRLDSDVLGSKTTASSTSALLTTHS